VTPLGLVPCEEQGDRLLLPEDAAAFKKFKPSGDAEYALVSSLDAISAARRDVATLVDAKDQDTVAKLTFGERAGSSLMDLAAHAIFDRGRLIGYWEFDFDEQRIVWATFARRKTSAPPWSTRRKPMSGTSSATRVRSASTAPRAGSRDRRAAKLS